MNEKSIYVDATTQEWRELPEKGIYWKKLLFDEETGRSTVLVKFEPGAIYHPHSHPAGEEYYVLEGSLEDGGRTWRAGSYVYHPPGSKHRPRSDEGCLLFIVLPQPIQPLTDTECREFLGMD